MHRAVLRRAANEREWLDKAPAPRMYREPKRRVRWLTPEQLNELLQEPPAHQREAAIFAVATGLRQANVVGLEWSQANLDSRTVWIYADQAKGGRDIHVSRNETAVAVLRRQVGKHVERAGIENFRWHDLRHAWASWLAQKAFR